ncbi:efflux RND transporter periplasmic adaptor subunit [Frateuria aurantia]
MDIRSPDESGRGWIPGPEAGTRRLELLWQLAVRARAAASESTLAFTVVNETLALLPYRQAAWWRAPLPGAVACVSGVPQSDPGAPYVQWLGGLSRMLARSQWPSRPASVVDETAGSGPMPMTFTATSLATLAGGKDASSLLEDWNNWWPQHAVWVPLQRRAGHPLGAVMFAREEAWSPTDLVLLAELAAIWSHAFDGFAPQLSWGQRVRQWLRPGAKRRWLLAGLLVACLLPVRLTVLASAEVTAQTPFIVRSPLDGVIEKLDIQPNQTVTTGQRLLSLDPATLASRYALAQKDYDTAQEEYRQASQLAVTDARDRLDMVESKGKLDQSEVQLQYSAQQFARVRVVSPRNGVAVFADPNDWNGKAVSVGEKILAIADPARVELTAWLPVADNVDVKAGSTLTLYPGSSPLASYDARIDSIAYRAETTPQGILAYRVKASFQAGARHPGLGTMGTARIHGGWVPLSYYLLRRPLTIVRQWLGW